MKIDKIIFASDDNPTYLSYWEINAKVCREILKIEPVLFWITDEDSDFYHDGHGIVKKIKRLPDYIEEVWGQTFHSSGFQAQNVRLWGTKFFPEEVCLTSDIDLILFNREYIDENVKISDPEDIYLTGIFHVYSEEDVTKAQLLHFFNKKWNLKLKVEEVVSENSVNRTLRTNKDFNGILNLPNIESMINEL